MAGGCINQVGMQGNNITRTSWLAAGLPLEVPASTTSTQCGSGQQATMWAHSLLASGLADIVIACGVESMTNVPLGSNVPRRDDGEAMYGERFTDRYEELYEGTNQFEGGERIAAEWDLTRESLDAFGARSQQLAARAWDEGRFDTQIIPLKAPVIDESGAVVDTIVHDRDEGLRETTAEGLANLKPTGGEGGYHTAGTSSQIADAAGALLMMTAAKAAEVGATPLARVVDSCLVGSDPVLMLTGPIPATQKLLADNDPEPRRHRHLRDQRGFRLRGARLGQGTRPGDRRSGQPQRRRHRHRPRAGIHRPHPHHQDGARAATLGRPLRPDLDVLRRWPGHGHADRARLTGLVS